MEIMEPQLQQREKEGRKEGRKEGLRMGIQGAVDAMREFGHKDYEIRTMIIRKYGLSEEEAEKYLQ